MRPLLFFLLFPIFLWGVRIEFKNITSHSIPIQHIASKKPYYQLTAKYYFENFQTKNFKFFLLNRKKYMLKYNYYQEGIFKTKSTELHYGKAYTLGTNIYLFEVKGKINQKEIKAKEVIYDKRKTYYLKKCEIKMDKNIIRRNNYSLIEI